MQLASPGTQAANRLNPTLRRLCIVGAMLSCALAGSPAQAELKVSTFKLANGMQVVVIPDHRVPVVTHMVWYRAGAADDPWGTSGIAHFLEHLMFKSTGKIKSGEFSRIITQLGGRDNAATDHDTTSYYQRVAKEHLRRVMELEADRMVNLKLIEAEVRTERDVILEERRTNVDGNPLSIMSEQMSATLYQNHPYHRPALGWEHEMAKLSLKDAAAFYRRFYAPNNAILVVAGDVTPEEVRPLAEATYGRNKANAAVGRAPRPQAAPNVAVRHVTVVDARAGEPLLLRNYATSGYASARPGEAESLELLSWIMGGDETGRLYRRFVAGDLASVAGSNFDGNTYLEGGRLAVVAIPLPNVSTQKVEDELDSLIADIVANGVKPEELDRAKAALEAKRVFDLDNQTTLANLYGRAIALGRSVADIEALPARMQAITADDIMRAAQTYLKAERSVTGILTLPAAAEATSPKPTATK